MPAALTEREKKRGMGYAFVGQTLGILLFMLFLRSAFGPLFLKHLGASDQWTLWVLATPLLLPVIQMPLALLVHPRWTKRLLIIGWSLYGGALVTAALLLSFPEGEGTLRGVAIAMVPVAIVANIAANTFWFPLLHDVVPGDFRGRFFGRLRAAWGILLYLAIVMSGLFLGEAPESWRFQTVILTGVALVVLRNILIARVPTLSREAEVDNDHRAVMRYLGELVAREDVRRFLAYFTLLTCSLGFLGHPLVLYMRDLGFNPGDNIILFGFTVLGMVTALLKGGGAMDRLGTRRFFEKVHVAACGVLVVALVTTFVPLGIRFWALGGVFVISGATMALANLACTAHLFQLTPERGRIFFLSLTNFMLFVGPAFGNLAAGVVLAVLGEARGIEIHGMMFNIFQLLLLTAAITALFATVFLKQITTSSNPTKLPEGAK